MSDQPTFTGNILSDQTVEDRVLRISRTTDIPEFIKEVATLDPYEGALVIFLTTWLPEQRFDVNALVRAANREKNNPGIGALIGFLKSHLSPQDVDVHEQRRLRELRMGSIYGEAIDLFERRGWSTDNLRRCLETNRRSSNER